jgi:hypothetical protein
LTVPGAGIRRIGRAVRLGLGAAALLGAASCGGQDAGDCVTQGLVRMGRENLTSLAVTCELPSEGWMVVFPADVQANDLPQLPHKYWPVVEKSAADGHTWCASAEPPDSAPTDVAMACSRLVVEVRAPMAVHGRRFVAELRLRADGKGMLEALTAPGR